MLGMPTGENNTGGPVIRNKEDLDQVLLDMELFDRFPEIRPSEFAEQIKKVIEENTEHLLSEIDALQEEILDRSVTEEDLREENRKLEALCDKLVEEKKVHYKGSRK